MACLYHWWLDALERDAELGIDRETTDLVSMLEEKGNIRQFELVLVWLLIHDTEEGSSTFFKFKEEKLFDATNNSQDTVNTQFCIAISLL